MRSEVAFLDSLQGRGIRPGLSRMKRLLSRLGHPERACRTIIVAGTNGKGSTSATLASILTEAGYRTGLYTSPHLVTLLERWQVDRSPVDPATFRRAVRELQAAVRESEIIPTYFEALTLVGFLIFREIGCDVVVLEVGMGGRLDATNVTNPLLAIITSVSFDHTDYLGKTLALIANEKAGVIHEGSVALTTNRSREVLSSIRKRAAATGVRLHLLSAECTTTGQSEQRGKMSFTLSTPEAKYQLVSPLIGKHQLDNISAAVRGAELAMPALPRIDAAAIERGVRRTEWRGRLERATVGGKRWLVDGAHNPDSVARLVDYLAAQPKRKRTLVFAAMKDKDVAAIATNLFSLFDVIVFTRADIERGMLPEMLRELALRGAGASGPRVTSQQLIVVDSPNRAFARALTLARTEIVVAGSLYLAGAAVAFLDAKREKAARPSAAKTRASERKSAR